MEQQQVSINLDAINREAIFAETLAERNRQLMMALSELQQLRETLRVAQEEIQVLRGEVA